MKDCIFCKIINDEIPSRTIYEDEIIKVIMNINPVTDGHLLLMPKKHLININEIDSDFISHSHKIIKDKLYPLLKEKLSCEGLTLEQNNELGQEIKHYHIHLVPRYQKDNIEFIIDKDNISDLDTIFNKLK